MHAASQFIINTTCLNLWSQLTPISSQSCNHVILCMKITQTRTMLVDMVNDFYWSGDLCAWIWHKINNVDQHLWDEHIVLPYKLWPHDLMTFIMFSGWIFGRDHKYSSRYSSLYKLVQTDSSLLVVKRSKRNNLTPCLLHSFGRGEH